MPKIPSPSCNGQHHNEPKVGLEDRVKRLGQLLKKFEPVPREWIRRNQHKKYLQFEPAMVCLDDVAPEPVEWLWEPRIAIGKLTLIIGVPGLGKSMITAYIAARTSQGGPWHPHTFRRGKPGSVVLMSCEDGLADTIQPRLVAAGADLKRIHALVGAKYKRESDNETEEVSIDLKRHLDTIEAAVESTPDCRLLILDPISGYLAGIDSHKDGEVRPILAKLAGLAEKQRIAIVAVAHMNKSATQAAIHRASGSTAFGAAPRAVFGVVQDPDDETGRRRLFLPIKVNLNDDRNGYRYSISKNPDNPAPTIIWLDEVNLRIDDVLGTRHEKGPEPVKRNEAIAFLKTFLGAGPKLANDVKATAKAAGIAEKTLRHAKTCLGIRAEKRCGRSVWVLPQVAPVAVPNSLIKTTEATRATKPRKHGA